MSKPQIVRGSGVSRTRWRAGSVFGETWLSLLSQICSHSAHQAQGLQESFGLMLRPCSQWVCHDDKSWVSCCFLAQELNQMGEEPLFCISISASFLFSPFLLCIIFPFDSTSLFNGEINSPGSILSEKD